MSDPNLQACPFCGDAEPQLGEVRHGDRASHGFIVKCRMCSANVDRLETAEEAIEEWNRRTPSPVVGVDAAQTWQPMKTAPRDGTEFVWLRRITVVAVGKAARYEYEARLMYRYWFGQAPPEGPGFWMTKYGGSVPDLDATGWWMPLPPTSSPVARVDAAQPVALRTALDVTLTKEEAEWLASFVGADLEADEDTLRLLIGDGHSGYGLYASCPEYPEEGAILVKNLPAPTPSTASSVDAPVIGVSAGKAGSAVAGEDQHG